MGDGENKNSNRDNIQPLVDGDDPFILTRIGRRIKDIKDDLATLVLFMLGYEYLT